jgi:SAM-dependent methyltransferase
MGMLRGREFPLPLGRVRLGDFNRTSPVSQSFGFDRGNPIDRYYIEAFMEQNKSDVCGRVLELHDDSYTRRFGGSRVTHAEIMSAESNPRATVIGDLEDKASLPESAFDCIILTQVLQLVFNLESALDTLHRALKPGGVLLITAPGITRMNSEWPWYWSFTTHSLQRLLEKKFGRDSVTVKARGNVFAATTFLYGLAVEELSEASLEVDDERFPVTISARVVRSL